MTRTLPWVTAQKSERNASKRLRAPTKQPPVLRSDTDANASPGQGHVIPKEGSSLTLIPSIPQE